MHQKKMEFSSQDSRRGVFFLFPGVLWALSSHCSGVWLSATCALAGEILLALFPSDINYWPCWVLQSFRRLNFNRVHLTWAHGGLQKSWDPLEMWTLVRACTRVCIFLKRRSTVFIRFSQQSPKIKTMIIRARGVALHHPLMQGTFEEVRCGLPSRSSRPCFISHPGLYHLVSVFPYLLPSKFFVFIILPPLGLFLNQDNSFVFPVLDYFWFLLLITLKSFIDISLI